MLNITSMDDSFDVPYDPGKYTLEFQADGRMAISADCNRATGSWSSESANRQSFGPEPLDAYRQYLEERQAAGDFEIIEPLFEDEFWRYYRDQQMHDFYEPGTEERAFENPPWEMYSPALMAAVNSQSKAGIASSVPSRCAL